MSLLFDENLSRRLIRRLEAGYPQSEHVELVGLKGQVDLEVWEYAARHDATIVSKEMTFGAGGEPSRLGPSGTAAELSSSSPDSSAGRSSP